MATAIYFVKATYEGSTYKLSDFFTGSTYKQNASKMIQVDMAFNDGPTTLDTQIRTLPDTSDIRNHTHIMVPSKQKIYRIEKVDEPNYGAYRLYLSDDPLIANYHEFRSWDMYVTRTNDPAAYTGLNDIPSLGTYPESVLTKNSGGVGGLTGDWLLVYIQALDPDQKALYQKTRYNLNLGSSWTPFSAETFTSLASLIDKYPEYGPFNTIEETKNSMPFEYGAIVKVSYTYYIKTSVFESSKYYIKWIPVNPEYINAVSGWRDINLDYNDYGVSDDQPMDLTNYYIGYRFYRTDLKILVEVRKNSYGFKSWVTIMKIKAHGILADRSTTPTDGDTYAVLPNKIITQYFMSPWGGSDRFTLETFTEPSTYLREANIFPNQPVYIYAFPMMTNLWIGSESTPQNYISATAFKSMDWYNGTNWQAFNILSTRIVNGQALINSVTINEPTNNNSTIAPSLEGEWQQLMFPGDMYYSPRWCVAKINGHIKDINVSFQSSPITNYTLREPFKYHELWIYGQKYDIPSFLVHRLYLRQSINSNGLNYMIYKDADYKDLYISGVASMEVQWNVDSLASWVAQNPTYKDEFNLRKQQQWAETLSGAAFAAGTGAASGAMIPVVGPAAGAAMGVIQGASAIATTAIKTHFQEKAMNLGLNTQRLLVDKLYGDTASSLQYWNIRHGIYWVVKTMNNDSQMKYQYDTVGYPTNQVKNINLMPWTTYNYTLGVYSKLIYGYFNKTIVNSYITQAINNKLKDGITLVE